MASDVALTWQPSLFDAGEPAVDGTFASIRRERLDSRSWVEVAPAWVRGADELFDALLEAVGWRQRNRWMYDQRVDEPRLTSSWKDADGVPIHPAIEAMRTALSTHYGVAFVSGGLNLYRDGRDSVAWHGDRIPEELTEPIVGIVSLGHARSFRLRPRGGGPSREFRMQRGDLLVTGGRCQREWEHSIPKVANAGPRLSITFRHTDPAPPPRSADDEAPFTPPDRG
ncbi:MAG TPA: alpha-ketoglutarate-dependent dioxygenase AlkB [Acidimicrobiales bacterium]